MNKTTDSSLNPKHSLDFKNINAALPHRLGKPKYFPLLCQVQLPSMSILFFLFSKQDY